MVVVKLVIRPKEQHQFNVLICFKEIKTGKHNIAILGTYSVKRSCWWRVIFDPRFQVRLGIDFYLDC